jgi:glycosyltransferase involved in cell wall biosynthesis
VKITFVSNYINHHQLPFCRAMSQAENGTEFYFVQVMPMEEKRVSMGWAVDEKTLPFVVLYYEDEERARDLILNSDVVLFGWTEGMIEDLEEKRLSSGKLSFRVSERIYREGQWKFLSPKGLMHKYREHFVYRNMPVYLLCTGAYVASDFHLIESYPGKMLKWGYFPDAGVYSFPEKEKEGDGSGIKKILWAGRLIELKHPEYAVKLARHLKKDGAGFELEIIGEGPMKERLLDMVETMDLADVVKVSGGRKPPEVIEAMKRADIFLFTSNYLEGWGAVVNEAMQCGCAVVASAEAGSVPFLISEGFNGLVYQGGSYADFEKKVMELFEKPEMIPLLGQWAFHTINSTWNARRAAGELVRFCSEFLEGRDPSFSEEGPMSRAQILKAPGALRTLQEKNRLE